MKTFSQNRFGFALVICLAMVVLIMAVVLAFFAQATANRAVEASRANAVEVEQAARNGLDYVVASFLSEISSNSTVVPVAGQTYYLPLAASNVVPARKVAAGITGTNFANLIRQSATGADANASTHGSSVAARNGRTIAAARWNAPVLLSGGGFSNAATLPNWIYLVRNPAMVATPSTNAIGRFAYNVYDVGGLLDANVAGYPPTVTDADLQLIKGTLAGADLTAIGLSATNITALIARRNPTTGSSPAFYLSGATNSAARGFLYNSAGDSEFTSRGELITWASLPTTWGASTASNALPLLTHFTRELARPSLNTNGILTMDRRYALSQLSTLTNTGLNGTLPDVTYTNTLAGTITTPTPNFFQVLRAAINYAGTWETNAPSSPFASTNWPSNLDLKAISIGANVMDQFSGTAQPTTVTFGTDRVAGKKQLPYVMQVFAVYNIEPGTPNMLQVSFIPQVWCGGVPQTATTLTGSISGGSISVGSSTTTLSAGSAVVTNSPTAGANPVFANATGTNLVTRGFFAVSVPLTNPTPESLTVTVNDLSFVSRISSGTNAYSVFGTSSATDLPVSAQLTAMLTLTNAIADSSTIPGPSDLAGVALTAADPRTLRLAGTQVNVSGIGSLTNAQPAISQPAYPASITDADTFTPTNRISAVGELSRVFRESPWRTIDFVSGSSSADLALLDVFSAFPTHASGLRAGTLNLNTRQSAVLAAMLSKAATRNVPFSTLSGSTANTLANQMITSTSATPLTNRAQLADLVAANVLAQAGDTLKESRETAVRALAEVGQTRTWNFLIDVVAQAGAFRGGTAAGNFQVDAERRYWLHIAIDRYTGRIVDQQLEPVSE